LVKELIRYRTKAKLRGVHTFDDYVKQVREGRFWKYNVLEDIILTHAFVSSVTDGTPNISLILDARTAILNCNEFPDDSIFNHLPASGQLKATYGAFSQEDRVTLTSPNSTAADFERLRAKYISRPDLVDVIDSYNPSHPLYKAKIAKIHEITRGTSEEVTRLLVAASIDSY
ncbi:MAG: hypothetical protein AAB540_00845, partial [Patescibacteria group bacterium]